MDENFTKKPKEIIKNIYDYYVFKTDFFKSFESWNHEEGQIISEQSLASNIFNTIIDDKILYINSVFDLPLGRFPVRQYDENAIATISEILNISLRDRKTIFNGLGLTHLDYKSQDVFYMHLLDVLENAPWYFPVVDSWVQSNKSKNKKGIKSLTGRLISYFKRKFNISDFSEDDENIDDFMKEILSLSGTKISEIFLLYLSTSCVHFNSWLEDLIQIPEKKKCQTIYDLIRLSFPSPPIDDIVLQSGEIFMESNNSFSEEKNNLLEIIKKDTATFLQGPKQEKAKDLSIVYSKLAKVLNDAQEAEEKIKIDNHRHVKSLVDRIKELNVFNEEEIIKLNDSLLLKTSGLNDIEEKITNLENCLNVAAKKEREKENSWENLLEAGKDRDTKRLEELQADIKNLEDEIEQLNKEKVVEKFKSFLLPKEEASEIEEVLPSGPSDEATDGSKSPQFEDISNPEIQVIKPQKNPETEIIDVEVEPIENQIQNSDKIKKQKDNSSKNFTREPATNDQKDETSNENEIKYNEDKEEIGRTNAVSATKSAAENEKKDWIDSRLSSLINDDQLAIAGRLSAAVKRTGNSVPIEPRALIVGALSNLNFEYLSEDIQKFSNLIVEVSPNCNQLDETLLFGSLLMPAFFGKDTQARNVIKRLNPNHGTLVDILRDEMGDLGFDFSPSMRQVSSFSNPREIDEVSEIKIQIFEWHNNIKNTNSVNKLGRTVLDAMISDPDLSKLILQIRKNGSKLNLERIKLVQEKFSTSALVEKQIRIIERQQKHYKRGGRSGNQLQSRMLEHVKSSILEGWQLICRWQTAVSLSNSSPNDKENQYAPIISRIRKIVGEAYDDLLNNGQSDNTLEGAIRRFLTERIFKFQNFLDGNYTKTDYNLQSSLAFSLDLLPPGCEAKSKRPFETCTDFTDITTSLIEEDARIIKSLDTNKIKSTLDAFREKLESKAFNSAFRLLKAAEISDEEYGNLKSDLEGEHEVVNKKLLEDLTILQRRLTELSSIDITFIDETRNTLSDLESIRTELESGRLSSLPDESNSSITGNFEILQHYEIIPIIGDARKLENKIEKQLKEDHLLRINKLIEDMPDRKKDLDTLKARINETPVQTIDDQIAQLSEGLPFDNILNEEQNAFESFYPNFVDKATKSDANSRGIA